MPYFITVFCLNSKFSYIFLSQCHNLLPMANWQLLNLSHCLTLKIILRIQFNFSIMKSYFWLQQETDPQPAPIVISPITQIERQVQALPYVRPIVIEPIPDLEPVTAPLQPVLSPNQPMTGNMHPFHALHQQAPNANFYPNNGYPQYGHQFHPQPVAYPYQQYPNSYPVRNSLNQYQNFYRLPPYWYRQQTNPVPGYRTNMTIMNNVGQHSLNPNGGSQGEMTRQVQPNMAGGWMNGGPMTQQFPNSSNNSSGQKRKSMNTNSNQPNKKR